MTKKIILYRIVTVQTTLYENDWLYPYLFKSKDSPLNIGVSGYNIQKHIILFCLKICFTFTNSVDPGEMQQFAAFYLGLHCLQKLSFMGFQNTKG